ncbi:MAG TPA: phage tail protein [Candidatus Entotheonella sp.]|jgi:phage tail-like protein
MAEPGTRNDPYRGYNFKLEIQGVTEAHFTECSGLGVRVNTIQYREAGGGQVVRRLPGPVEYADVTLRYGLTQSTELWEWMMSAVQGRVERKNISIVMLSDDGVTPALQWDLFEAWLSEWHGALLDAMGREAAIETMTLVYERMERA